jgi:hypothetical protein
MADLTTAQQQKFEILEASLSPLLLREDSHGELLGTTGAGSTSPVCAALTREERLQFRFMALYQTLVAVLAVMTLALIAVAAWSWSDEESFAAATAAASGVATGAGAVFLLAQRKDARDAHQAAIAGLDKHKCK